MSTNKTLKSLQILVTNQCNYRCRMCDIWKIKERQELTLNDLYLLRGLELEFVSISGGEPTLHPAIKKIIQFIRDDLKPEMLMLCSNGSNPARIRSILQSFPDLTISLSFDGRWSHDRIRGVPGAYFNLVDCMQTLLRNSTGRKILSFTCQKENVGEVVTSYKFATDNGFEFDFRLKENSCLYKGSKKETIISEMIRRQIEWLISNEVDPAKRFFYQGYLQKPDFSCLAGRRFAYLLPDKKFYPCLHRFEEIGSLEDGITTEINCKQNCWMDCYFYDNFWQLLSTMNCVDSKSKEKK